MGRLTARGFLLDSIVLIDHFNGKRAATSWIERNSKSKLFISVITFAEILVGCAPEEIDVIRLFLERFECLSLTQEVAETAARLRKKYHWKLPDAFQAALATNHNLLLVTRNTKDFPPRRHKFVHLPYR